jgi:hypothetical protein
MRSVAPIDTTGGDGERGGLGFYTGGIGGPNRLIVDASGGDLMEQMFGGRADAYAGDRQSINKALNGYVNSPEFKSKYGDMTPSVGMLTYLYESLPLVADELSTAESLGRPMYDLQHVGAGRVMFDFTINEDGVTIPLVIPMSEIGEWYMKQDMRNLTKP